MPTFSATCSRNVTSPYDYSRRRARRWPTRSAKTRWTISGCNRSTVRVADRSQTLIQSKFSISVGRRTERASAYSAAIPTPTSSCSRNPTVKLNAYDLPWCSAKTPSSNFQPMQQCYRESKEQFARDTPRIRRSTDPITSSVSPGGAKAVLVSCAPSAWPGYGRRSPATSAFGN